MIEMAISFLLCDGFTSNLNLYILDFNIYKKKILLQQIQISNIKFFVVYDLSKRQGGNSDKACCFGNMANMTDVDLFHDIIMGEEK